jgi:hypothetical protein
MAVEVPLGELSLFATSLADDLGFVALADLAGALGDVVAEYRVIGGHMMTGLVARWGLGAELYRATGDADFGAPPIVLHKIDLVTRLSDVGYEKVAGDRFEKRLTDIPASIADDTAELPRNACIDVLIPAYTSRARQNRKVGDSLVVTEAFGLADALLRPHITMTLSMRRLNGDVLHATLSFPDEVSALILKAGVTQARAKDTDVVDIWRCLEVCNAAGLRPDSFSTGEPSIAAAIVRGLFATRDGSGMAAIINAQNLSEEGADIRFTRIAALMERILGLDT